MSGCPPGRWTTLAHDGLGLPLSTTDPLVIDVAPMKAALTSYASLPMTHTETNWLLRLERVA